MMVSVGKVAKIMRQVPGDWKNTLSKPDPPNPKGFTVNSPADGKPVEITSLSTRNFYECLEPPSIEAAREKQASLKTPFYTTWSVSLGEITWPRVFKCLNSNHRDRKAADVIYILIHRGTVTRKRMKDMGLQEVSDCPRCQKQCETISHLFFECPESVEVWQFALRYLTVLDTQFNASFKRFVIAGWKYDDHPIDDIRMALVSTIWRSRNSTLFHSQRIDTLSYFRSRLTSLLEMRAISNAKADKSPCNGFLAIAFYSMGRVFLTL